jgi:hypothetical protein
MIARRLGLLSGHQQQMKASKITDTLTKPLSLRCAGSFNSPLVLALYEVFFTISQKF